MNKITKRTRKYFETVSVSASFLKAILKGPDAILKYQKTKGKGNLSKDAVLRKGSAVDQIITNKEDFYEEFYVIDIKNPSDSIMKVVENLYDNYPHILFLGDISYDKILKEINFQGFYGNSNYKDETKVNKILKEGANYFIQLVKSNGKVVFQEEELEECENAADIILNHPYVKKFEDLVSIPGIKVFNQVPIYWHSSEANIGCKSLLDRVIYNTTDTTIDLGDIVIPAKSVLPIDYKTLGVRSENAYQSYSRFRYDLSMSFYYDALKWKHEQPEFKYKGYTVLNPVLIFSSFACDYPSWYQLSHDDLLIAKFGGTYADIDGEGRRLIPCVTKDTENIHFSYKKVKGYLDAIRMMEEYLNNGTYIEEWKIFQNKGRITKM